MKKLMIAAAAAAMVGGAFAEDAIKIEKYNQIGTNEALQVCQVFQFKQKASTEKAINLDGAKKLFGKTTKYKEEAVDGVYYYDATNKTWVTFSWSKAEKPVAEFCSAPTFNIFENDEKTKALATYGWVNKFDEYDDKGNLKAEHAEAYTYGALKYAKKDGKKDLVRTVKSIKNVYGYTKYTIKTFKDQEQVNAYVKKLWNKAVKVSKNAK